MRRITVRRAAAALTILGLAFTLGACSDAENSLRGLVNDAAGQAKGLAQDLIDEIPSDLAIPSALPPLANCFGLLLGQPCETTVGTGADKATLAINLVSAVERPAKEGEELACQGSADAPVRVYDLQIDVSNLSKSAISAGFSLIAGAAGVESAGQPADYQTLGVDLAFEQTKTINTSVAFCQPDEAVKIMVGFTYYSLTEWSAAYVDVP
jgi:hypothetical protein